MAVREGCLVCGKEGGAGSQRVLEEESALYTDLLLGRQVSGSLSGLHWLCNICDRLVLQYEEIVWEQRSIRAQLEERLKRKNYFEKEETLATESAVENGEITDVENFAREGGVKIFEIDVKSEDVVTKIAEQIRYIFAESCNL